VTELEPARFTTFKQYWLNYQEKIAVLQYAVGSKSV